MSSARRFQNIPSAPKAARGDGGQQGGGTASPQQGKEELTALLLQRDNPEQLQGKGLSLDYSERWR